MSRDFLILIFAALSAVNLYSQSQGPFQSFQDRKSFADFLFCKGDYSRAASEYECISGFENNDSLFLKLGYSYLQVNNSKLAGLMVNKIRDSAQAEQLQGSIIMKHFTDGEYLKVLSLSDSLNKKAQTGQKSYIPISYFSSILSGQTLQGNFQLSIVSSNETDTINFLVNKVVRPEKKSELTAGLLSAVIPGAGKIYTGKTGDGITTFLITGLMTFLTVDNFSRNHSFRGYVFGVSTILFYGGSIYGSAASAQLMNEENERSARNQLADFVKLNEFLHPKTFNPGSVCK